MYKESINVPKASLFFFKKIKERLIEKKWEKNSNKTEIVVIISDEFPYSYDVIRCIERSFSKDGWKFRMTNYSRGKQMFSYTFRLEK